MGILNSTVTTAAGSAATKTALQSNLNAAATVTQIGSQIAGLIGSLSSAKQQQRATQAFQALSAQQQLDLNKQIAATTDENAKLGILVNALVDTKNNANTKKSQSYLVPALVILGVILVAGIFIVKIKKAS